MARFLEKVEGHEGERPEPEAVHEESLCGVQEEQKKCRYKEMTCLDRCLRRVKAALKKKVDDLTIQYLKWKFKT